MAGRKRWPRFNPTGVNIDYMQLVQIKVDAMKKLLHDWGVRLRAALKQESHLPTRSKLYQSISFKVETKSINELTAKIRLLVGVLDRKSPVLKYLKFILYGTTPHFAPVKYRSRYTGILTWARSKNLVYRKGNKWYWAGGKLKDKPFTGIPGQHNRANNFFKRVYDRYNIQIKREIRQILGSVS